MLLTNRIRIVLVFDGGKLIAKEGTEKIREKNRRRALKAAN